MPVIDGIGFGNRDAKRLHTILVTIEDKKLELSKAMDAAWDKNDVPTFQYCQGGRDALKSLLDECSQILMDI